MQITEGIEKSMLLPKASDGHHSGHEQLKMALESQHAKKHKGKQSLLQMLQR
eukprot:CAMPEP_0178414914 /NCGR_PEP_ID=MMETSP0689_2-20121128/23281_1 /TAXON_ID=160604 /ORGANISM="Amphidinium massartii, Strain CS-259" /LENGTH=51 /DNA_ID=CAMNT_0020036217 /DNA_START=100 /DNA_END=255 /DNA_ORIENTATION=+